ncbi:MAG: hypothetical protein SGI90_10995 [Candidatus Eisenbacteria bacterium]|nr:hypothetical protein [Candidatus Eisenbacteria bacterium]
MAMKIVTSGLKPHHRLDYVGIVRQLIAFVPPEHLVGIAMITVSGDRPIEDDDDVLGQYFERWERDPAVIVVYLEPMKREAGRWLRRFPLTWKVLIAQTLFHEIGHHYQRFSHGIAKTRQEDHAELYGERLARRAFPAAYWWIDRYRPMTAHLNRLLIRWLTLEARLFPLTRTHYEIGRRAWNEADWDTVIHHWEEAIRLDPGASGVPRLLREARSIRAREDRQLQLNHAARSNPLRLKHRQARRGGGRKKRRPR